VLCGREYRRQPGHCCALIAGTDGGWPWGCSRATTALPQHRGGLGGSFPPALFHPLHVISGMS